MQQNDIFVILFTENWKKDLNGTHSDNVMRLYVRYKILFLTTYTCLSHKS